MTTDRSLIGAERVSLAYGYKGDKNFDQGQK